MSIQVFILGKLMKENTYPYMLKKQISDPIPLDEFGGITESKLYYHFDSLVKQGLIQSVEVIKEENRPDKYMYEITAKGREALPKKIYKLFKDAESINDMVLGLSNIHFVDNEEVVKILETKLENYKAHWEHILKFQYTVQKDTTYENLTAFLGGYFSTKSDHMIYWLEELIKQIKNKEL